MKVLAVSFHLILLILILLCQHALGHEVRPGYLEIEEQQDRSYALLWKAPGRVDMVLKLSPKLPDDCRDLTPPKRQKNPGSLVERRLVSCGPGGLSGKSISIEGLQATITDVLVRIRYFDGSSQNALLKPHNPSLTIEGSQPWYSRARSYVEFGVQHILWGVDHLLFVLGLLLLSQGWMLLVKTITAFTVGHSISLALATFGFVNIPGKPLNAAIALSIVFLAAELVRHQRNTISLTIRYPWMVAFAFGLLHGLGFASGLVKLGLPESAIPLALFFFNVGVEIGQLLFVAVALALIASLKKFDYSLPGRLRLAPVYGMGSIAGYWFIQRLALMIA